MGNGYGLKFNGGTPEMINAGPVRQSAPYTYSDPNGDIVFYVTFDGVFNKNGNMMENGTRLVSTVSDIYIIPKPGSKGLYYVFYLKNLNKTGNWFNDLAVLYAIVDPSASKVIERDQVIYEGLHGHFTVSGKCSNDTYWLVGEDDTNMDLDTDTFVAYKITAAGIASEPVRSVPASIGNSAWLKFSPRGDKIVFTYRGNWIGNQPDEGVALSDFDMETGVVSKAIRLAEPGWRTEFSASGDKLYLAGLLERMTEVLQFDLSSGNEKTILASETRVYNGPVKLYNIQLAPDGKIYLTQVVNQRALAVINYPERQGVASEVKTEAIIFPEIFYSMLPVFSSNFLYNYPVKADAGRDRQLCQGQQVALGGAYNSNYTYAWEPSTHLSDPTSPNPVFRYTGSATERLELTYTLYVNDGSCTRRDEVKVTVLPPSENTVIVGSQLVCPGLVGAEYKVSEAQAGYNYEWAVTGGQIESGQGTSAIKVNWGVANKDAQVSVKAINSAGCEIGIGSLPVELTEELKPQNPQGPAQICLDQATGIRYTLPAANTHSVYNWNITGGSIIAGQGSSEVIVNWHASGNNKLWVQEQSNTATAVCAGTSEILEVTVVEDKTTIALTLATISSDSGDKAALDWEVSGTLPLNSEIILLRRISGSEAWTKVAGLQKDTRGFQDSNLQGSQEVYEYKLQTTNSCGLVLESNVHRTIRLQSQVNVAQSAATLTWSAYAGWPQGVAFYEVWGKIDSDEAYMLMHRFDSSTLSFTGIDPKLGFNHHYKIRAVAADGNLVSWSNSILLMFQHTLQIPNIFTPNGDGLNDTFLIPMLELYPDNELVVFNRLGNEVYRKKSYQSNWTGENVTSGTYFYQLYIKKLNRYYKGWVEIVK